MRTTITTTSCGDVVLSYDDFITGDRHTRTFFCPSGGGYVREEDSYRNNPQVCDGLSRRGPTLMASSDADLIRVIRREYRRMRRFEATV